MFFFFVGGLEQQVRQVLKSGMGRCVNCSSPADLVEYDKVLKLFFVPVWRWPGKDPLLYCNNCKFFFPQSYSFPSPPKTTPSLPEVSDILRCRFCERVVEPDYRFCPFCGSELDLNLGIASDQFPAWSKAPWDMPDWR
ncbi:uncharacterized protein LOC129294752 isoform X1 [Prosopis cineraria]|uniref:uncharacterized protein LOC129294752 isoform X1 n=1 Tax=Prosopis cineraria TaxID=364024 RepID=UPI00240FBAE1|nr:uncharacterized protein LOC129294752 isoform X1 [Prosopis cineraria]